MGSLGKDVAAAVADRLGKQVIHHEIIDNLASKMRLRKSHVIRFLEGKPGSGSVYHGQDQPVDLHRR